MKKEKHRFENVFEGNVLFDRLDGCDITVFTYHNEAGNYAFMHSRAIVVVLAKRTASHDLSTWANERLMRAVIGVGMSACAVTDRYSGVRVDIATGRAIKDLSRRENEVLKRINGDHDISGDSVDPHAEDTITSRQLSYWKTRTDMLRLIGEVYPRTLAGLYGQMLDERRERIIKRQEEKKARGENESKGKNESERVRGDSDVGVRVNTVRTDTSPAEWKHVKSVIENVRDRLQEKETSNPERKSCSGDCACHESVGEPVQAETPAESR